MRHLRRLGLLILAVPMLAVVPPAHAAGTSTWKGPHDGVCTTNYWNDANCWDGGVPTADSVANISSYYTGGTSCHAAHPVLTADTTVAGVILNIADSSCGASIDGLSDSTATLTSPRASTGSPAAGSSPA